MLGKANVEAEEDYASYEHGHERESLLPTTSSVQDQPSSPKSSASVLTGRIGFRHLTLAFLAGALTCVATQLVVCGPSCFTGVRSAVKAYPGAPNANNELAPPWAGSTSRDPYPPPSPTNAYPSLFPSNVGYPGGTPTGAEPAVIATAPIYPIHTGAAQLVVPATLGHKGKKGKGSKGFDMFRKWGNLSPWYSVDRTAFGIDSGPETPETCRVTGLHFLHRHGARYPTSWGEFPSVSDIILRFMTKFSAAYGGPANFSGRLNAVAEKWNASGDLEFMNDWYVAEYWMGL